ncbi:glycosyltransferase family 4 protein [Ectothiorhodospira marina]|uniref:Glycosyltransferase involved in cell wall bisynthesis n=1 Tax=Ectothiorhodospira marina TaxID=1396821 RepID=A0A1H7IDX4_9GAMM|nr:glycosyltransferase family 4 protein [Ectothiorhodospira marina]SEK59710.1 Glycosyltransferase involved in cell wall bisynthesis [Ectothiorhodospira marina]
MNLLFTTGLNPYGSRPFGGAETSIRLLAESMAARGHKVIYLTLRAEERDYEIAKAAGVKLWAVPALRGNRFRLVRAVGKLRLPAMIALLALRYRIDVLYCFYEIDVMEAALRVRNWLRRPKVVVRMAGFLWHSTSTRDPRLRTRYELAFNSVDSVNFVTEGLVEMTEKGTAELGMQVRFRDTFVHDIGCSSAPVRTLPYNSLPQTPFRMLMVGRFASYSKRQDLLVKAVALIPEEIPVSLTLVGEGPDRPAIQALVEQLNLSHRVEIIPFIDQKILWKRLQEEHLLCHATNSEGLAKAILEAMAKGLPVLASNVASVNSCIREGETGFLVDNNPESWADRMIGLSRRPEDLARVSEAGQKHVLEQWDPAKCAQQYETYFERL